MPGLESHHCVLNGAALSASNFWVHLRNVPPPLMHIQTLYQSVRQRVQLFAALSESERVKSDKDELCLHRSTARLIPWLPMGAFKSAKHLACSPSD